MLSGVGTKPLRSTLGKCDAEYSEKQSTAEESDVPKYMGNDELAKLREEAAWIR